MKILLLNFILVWSYNSYSAETKNFTAIGSGAKSIFVSTKKNSKTTGFASALFELNEKKIKEISISPEIQEREIVGIFSSKKSLYLISQLTTEQGDNPILFERSGSKWVKVKDIDCPNFTKIDVYKSNLTVFCEVESKDSDKVTQTSKIINISSMNVDKKISIPQVEIVEHVINAKFSGTPFEWDKVFLQGTVNKEYKISEF